MFTVVHRLGTQAKIFFLISAVFLVASSLFSVVFISSAWAGPSVTSSTASSMSTTLPRVLTNSATRAGLRVALPSIQIPQTLQSPRGLGGVLRGGRSLMKGATKGATKGAIKGALGRVPAGRLLVPLAVGGLLWRGWPWRTGYPGAKRTLENSLSGKWSAGPTLMTTRKHTSQSARRRDPDVAANAAAARAAAALSVEELREDYELALAAYLAITPRQWRWRMQLYIKAPLLLDELERVPRQRLIEDIAAKLDLRSRRSPTKTSVLSSKKQGLYIFIVYMMSLDPPSQVEVARRLGIPSSNVRSMISAIQQIILRRRAHSLASPTVDSSIASGIARGIAPGIASKTVQPYDHSKDNLRVVAGHQNDRERGSSRGLVVSASSFEGSGHAWPELSLLIEEYRVLPVQQWRRSMGSLFSNISGANSDVDTESMAMAVKPAAIETVLRGLSPEQLLGFIETLTIEGYPAELAQFVYLSFVLQGASDALDTDEHFVHEISQKTGVSDDVIRRQLAALREFGVYLLTAQNRKTPPVGGDLPSSSHVLLVSQLEGPLSVLIEEYESMPHQRWHNRNSSLLADDPVKLEVLSNIPRKSILEAIEKDHGGSKSGANDHAQQRLKGIRAQYVYLSYLMKLGPPKKQSLLVLAKVLEVSSTTLRELTSSITRLLDQLSSGTYSEEVESQKFRVELEGKVAHLTDLYVDMPYNQWLERMTLVVRDSVEREALMSTPREDHLRAIDEYSHTLSRHTGGRGDSHYFEIRALSYQYVFLAHMMRLAPKENRSDVHLTRYLAYTFSYHHRVINHISVALRSLAQRFARHERSRGSEAHKNARVGIRIETNKLRLVNSPEWGVVDESILVRRYNHYAGLRKRMLEIDSEELRKRLQDLLPGKVLPKSLKPRMVLNYLETQFSQGPAHLFLAYDLAIAPRSYRGIIEGYYPNVDLSEDIGVTKEIIDQLDSLAQRGFHIEYLSIGEYSLLNKVYWGAPWRTKAMQQKILHWHHIDPDHAESFIEGVEQLRGRYRAESQVLYGSQLQDPRARYKELVLAGYLYYGHDFAIEDAYTDKVPPFYTLYFQRAEVRDDFMALVAQLSIPPH